MGSSPPQYIYLDLHGTVRNPSLIKIGHLIVYGVKETISNVDPSVYDTAFVIENGQMEMQTDLSLNPPSDCRVNIHRHKRISLKLQTALRSFFAGTLSSSRIFTSVKSGWYQTINPNSFQMPSSGILAIELNMGADIWKSYSAIILRIEYQTSA